MANHCDRINLDAQASTPLHPRVMEAMMPFQEGFSARSGASYFSSKEARRAKCEAKEKVAALIGAKSPEEILFAHNEHAANHLAVVGHCAALRGVRTQWFGSACDHASVRLCAPWTDLLGFHRETLSVNHQGLVKQAEAIHALNQETLLVTAPLCIPEWGSMEKPIELGQACHDMGITFFLDATHGGGWIPLNVSAEPWHFLSLAPHRFHGPRGVGVLFCRHESLLDPMVQGVVAEGASSPGIENVAAMVGAGEACALLSEQRRDRADWILTLRQLLVQKIAHSLSGVAVLDWNASGKSMDHYLTLVLDGVDGEALVLMANVRGLECHAGLSCRVGHEQANILTKACEMPDWILSRCVTFSWHAMSTEEEILQAVAILGACMDTLRQRMPSRRMDLPGGMESITQWARHHFCVDDREYSSDSN